VIAAKAVALAEAAQPGFADYARAVVANARALAEALQGGGLAVLTGGTDNHLVMVDLRGTGLTGRIAETALREAGVTCNRNPIPDDPEGAWYTSGLRLGTAALTTLDMGTAAMAEVGKVICRIVGATKPAPIPSGPNAGQPSRVRYELDPVVVREARAHVNELLARFPLYPEIELAIGSHQHPGRLDVHGEGVRDSPRQVRS
jgi:glycine hydroxymethyltransferase